MKRILLLGLFGVGLMSCSSGTNYRGDASISDDGGSVDNLEDDESERDCKVALRVILRFPGDARLNGFQTSLLSGTREIDLMATNNAVIPENDVELVPMEALPLGEYKLSIRGVGFQSINEKIDLRASDCEGGKVVRREMAVAADGAGLPGMGEFAFSFLGRECPDGFEHVGGWASPTQTGVSCAKELREDEVRIVSTDGDLEITLRLPAGVECPLETQHGSGDGVHTICHIPWSRNN